MQPGGRFVAVGCGARPTRVWDTAHDRLLAELPSVICYAVSSYACGMAQMASESTLPGVARLGMIVWMCRVALTAEPPPPVSLDGVADAMQGGSSRPRSGRHARSRRHG